jgi:hypothetical protein
LAMPHAPTQQFYFLSDYNGRLISFYFSRAMTLKAKSSLKSAGGFDKHNDRP